MWSPFDHFQPTYHPMHFLPYRRHTGKLSGLRNSPFTPVWTAIFLTHLFSLKRLHHFNQCHVQPHQSGSLSVLIKFSSSSTAPLRFSNVSTSSPTKWRRTPPKFQRHSRTPLRNWRLFYPCLFLYIYPHVAVRLHRYAAATDVNA